MAGIPSKYHEISQSRDWMLKLSYRYEIWQAPKHRCCRDSCQISERWSESKLMSSPWSKTLATTDHRWIPLTKGQRRGPLVFPLMLTCVSCWTNSRVAGDLKHHDDHVTSLYAPWNSLAGVSSISRIEVSLVGVHLVLLTQHYNDIIMRAMASQITSLTIVYSIVYSGADQRKYQSSASLAFVRGIHRWPAQRASNAENVSIWWRHHESVGQEL